MKKSTQVNPVVCPNPPEPAWKTLRKLERAHTKLMEENEYLRNQITILKAKLKDARKR